MNNKNNNDNHVNGIGDYIGGVGHTWTSTVAKLSDNIDNRDYVGVIVDLLLLFYILPSYSLIIGLFHMKDYREAVAAEKAVEEQALPVVKRTKTMRRVGVGVIAIAALSALAALANNDEA